VAANGSVRLEAADGAIVIPAASASSSATIAATQGGTLTIGPQSEIDIDIDSSSTQTAAYNPNLSHSNIS